MTTFDDIIDRYSRAAAPQRGDKAFTVYRGTEYVGTLDNLTCNYGEGEIVSPPSEPLNPNGCRLVFCPDEHRGCFQPHSNPEIWVGYEDKIVWDEERQMFYAPADSD